MPKERKLKANDYYQTPERYWRGLCDWLGIDRFSCDPCSPMDRKPHNVEADVYWTEETDGLSNDWGEIGGHVFVNPPYSQVIDWVNKAIEQADQGRYVWLLLNQGNANYWPDVIHPRMDFKVSLRSRISFVLDGMEKPNNRYDNYLVLFAPPGDNRYCNYLRSSGGTFPFEGELVYNIKRIGLKTFSKEVESESGRESTE